MEPLRYQTSWAEDSRPFKWWDADRQIGSSTAAHIEAAAFGGQVTIFVHNEDCVASVRLGQASVRVWKIASALRGLGGMVIFDNCEGVPCDDLERLAGAGVIVRVISNAPPPRGTCRDAVVYRTTTADALADGLFEKIKIATGTSASVVEWASELNALMGGCPDAPRWTRTAVL